MKNFLLSVFFLLAAASSSAQDHSKTNKLLQKGLTLNQKGEYMEALSTFNKVLQTSPDNLPALSEKANTLYALGMYDEATKYCRKAIKKHPTSSALKQVYVTYGSALDKLKQRDKSLHIDNEGIKKFPDYYLLYFNKAAIFAQIGKVDQAIENFQESAELNPDHAPSHLALAILLKKKKKNLPALLASCRFLELEQQGKKAEAAFSFIQEELKGPSTEEESIKATFRKLAGDPPLTQHSKAENKDLLQQILDTVELPQTPHPVRQFIHQFNAICSWLGENNLQKASTQLKYYAPHFITMKKRHLIKPFSYKIYALTQKPYINQWINHNNVSIIRLYSWIKTYSWNKQSSNRHL